MIKSALIIFSVFALLLFIKIPSASAQSCNGTYTCSRTIQTCTPTGCAPDPYDPGACSCTYTQDTVDELCAPQALGGICPAGNINEYCIARGYENGAIGGNCTQVAACDSSNCFNRACTSNGQTCTCYGFCSGGSCTTGGTVPGTCSGGGGGGGGGGNTPCAGTCAASAPTNYSYSPSGDAYCQQQSGNYYCWVPSALTPCAGTCAASAPTNYSYSPSGDAACQQQSGNYYCWVPSTPTASPTATAAPTATQSPPPNCNPFTCSTWLNQCGYHDNGCNGQVFCGACPTTTAAPTATAAPTSPPSGGGGCTTSCLGGYTVVAGSGCPPSQQSIIYTGCGIATPTPTTCPSAGSNSITYCDGYNVLFQQSANGTCGTQTNQLQDCLNKAAGFNGCATDSATSAHCVACYAAGSYPTTYCSGNNVYQQSENGTCGTQNNLLQTCNNGCVTDSSTSAHCTVCPAYGSNYITYCSGDNVYQQYANGSCGTQTNQIQACNGGCITAGSSAHCAATIMGVVFLDTNKNGVRDAGESEVSSSINITAQGPNSISVTYPTAGSYKVTANSGGDLSGNNYTVSYSVPPGFIGTEPAGGGSFSVTPGGSCNLGGSKNAFCSSGNILNLDFGVVASNPWIQSTGNDIRVDSGFQDKIPANASCGSYSSIAGNGGTPGIIYSGSRSYSFGQGSASSTNWVAGGNSYPESYTPTRPNLIRTSYNYLLSVAKQAVIVPTDISTYCSGGISSCTLSVSLPNGLYIANGPLTLSGNYTFPTGKNFVILVNGDLNIKGKVHVPNGSTATFSSSGNITVDRIVGEGSSSSTVSDVEGFYSADRNFIVDGANNCWAGADLRLNMAGSVIVNAALNGGTFQNNRSLCAGNDQCPAFSVAERPDFFLNAPAFIRHPSYVWQETAP